MNHTPWAVIQSPTDPELYAVQGEYLVADKLPIEDANLVASAEDMLADLVAVAQVFRSYGDMHAAKPDPAKAQRNYAWADRLTLTIARATGAGA